MHYMRFSLLLLPFLRAIPIPNGQIGDAEVDCQENQIEMVFATEENFLGRIYVIGHANDSKCVSRETGTRSTSIVIPLDECGFTRTRSADPPGLFISTKVMLSFHDQFITKVDRGYDVQCFYMEAEKTVTYPLSVSMNPLAPFSVAAEMPRCKYEVIDPKNKKPIEIATVGQQLLHTWTCESSSPDLWCMRVHSCFVEDDKDTQITILDDEGCAVDRYLLDNLEYGPGDLRAQKEAHAFKFADNVVVNFQCSVRLDIRDGECNVPECPELGRRRRVRSVIHNVSRRDPDIIEMDVRAPRMQIIDKTAQFEEIGSISRRNECNPFLFILPLSLLMSTTTVLLIALVIVTRRRK